MTSTRSEEIEARPGPSYNSVFKRLCCQPSLLAYFGHVGHSGVLSPLASRRHRKQSAYGRPEAYPRDLPNRRGALILTQSGHVPCQRKAWRWRVSIIRKRGEVLGTVEAPDQAAAEAEAVSRLGLTDERKRLVLQEAS
jgi:hypothetical protein